jgi:opacity protein-like surface antigen
LLVFKEFLMRKTFMLSALLALAIPAAALAQDKPVEVNFGAGFTFPVGDVADSFDTGWNFAAGLTFNVNETVGIQGEYQFFRFEGPDRVFDNALNPGGDRILIESNHQMNVVDFNVVLRAGGTSGVRGYVLAGPGVYWRKVQLTTPSVGFVTVCDPFWLVCFPTAVSVDAIIGDRTVTDFGMNVGGGVAFGAFYVEARYHYVWGKDVTPSVGGVTGQKLSTQASYFPITFGFRF